MKDYNIDFNKVKQVKRHQMENPLMFLSYIGIVFFFFSIINIQNTQGLYILVLLISFVYPIKKFIWSERFIKNLIAEKKEHLLILNPKASYLLIKSGYQKGMALGIIIEGFVNEDKKMIRSYRLGLEQAALDQFILEINQLNEIQIEVVKGTLIENNFEIVTK